MALIRRCIRLPVLLVHTCVGVLCILLAVGWDKVRGTQPHLGLSRRFQAFWCRSLCWLFGVSLEVRGERIQSPVLLAANHVSWLDILVVASFWPVCFLSKSEVRRWPGIGAVATALGTIYIARGERNGSGEAIEAMSERLAAGRQVLFFPEGTTSPGSELLPFRPRLFQAAIAVGAPVQPLTIQYFSERGDCSTYAPFVDDEKLLRHVIRLAGEKETHAVLTLGEAVESEQRGRNELALLMREQMVEVINPSMHERA